MNRCPDCTVASNGPPDWELVESGEWQVAESPGGSFIYAGPVTPEQAREMFESIANLPRHVITPEEDADLWRRFCEVRTDCICGGTGYVA